jgi:DNA-3-methyladenine glycosylase I
VDGRTIVHRPRSQSEIRATTRESDAMSRDMKQRGFSFCGSTICYAYMQAAGLVDDHVVRCFRK